MVRRDQTEIVRDVELWLGSPRKRNRLLVIIQQCPVDGGLNTFWRTLVEHLLGHRTCERKILVGVVVRLDQHAVTLSGSDGDTVRYLRLSVDTINLHDLHQMLVEMDDVSHKCSHADYPDQVSFARLDVEFDILGIVDEGCIRNWFSALLILRVGEVAVDHRRHLLVVPVGQGEDDFFAVLVLVRRGRIMNDEGSTKAIRILAPVM